MQKPEYMRVNSILHSTSSMDLLQTLEVHPAPSLSFILTFNYDLQDLELHAYKGVKLLPWLVFMDIHAHSQSWQNILTLWGQCASPECFAYLLWQQHNVKTIDTVFRENHCHMPQLCLYYFISQLYPHSKLYLLTFLSMSTINRKTLR